MLVPVSAAGALSQDQERDAAPEKAQAGPAEHSERALSSGEIPPYPTIELLELCATRLQGGDYPAESLEAVKKILEEALELDACKSKADLLFDAIEAELDRTLAQLVRKMGEEREPQAREAAENAQALITAEIDEARAEPDLEAALRAVKLFGKALERSRMEDFDRWKDREPTLEDICANWIERSAGDCLQRAAIWCELDYMPRSKESIIQYDHLIHSLTALARAEPPNTAARDILSAIAEREDARFLQNMSAYHERMKAGRQQQDLGEPADHAPREADIEASRAALMALIEQRVAPYSRSKEIAALLLEIERDSPDDRTREKCAEALEQLKQRGIEGK